MKHTVKVTAMLLGLFLVAQAIGLFVLTGYIDPTASQQAGKPVYDNPPFDLERPQLAEPTSYIFIIIAVLIGTALIFLLMRFRQVRLWKLWFLMSVVICLTVAFGAFLPDITALALALVLGLWKVLRPNVYIHNATEVFVYAGLAAIFVPIMNVFSAFMLLVLISLYDMYAVWKSKHMVALAQFQISSKLFAGLSLAYDKQGALHASMPEIKQEKDGKGGKESRMRNAILGGGDIGFPLIFAGVVMKQAGYLALIVSVFAAIALGLLFMYGRKDRFYPAMPFVTIGCLLGYGLVLLF
ncbi:MAG: presenilin family intramembrane aspartyl protease [Nanoarchaeota archaeon]